MLSRKEKAGFAVLAVAAVAVMAVPILAKAKAEGHTVVAIVNGNKIFKSDVDNVLKMNKVKPADEKKAFPIIVNEMINEKLIDEAAEKAHVEKTAEFQRRLAEEKAQLAKSVYLENYLKSQVTNSAVKKAYEHFKDENKGKDEVHARQILVKTEAESKKIISALNHGASFETLAKEKSTDPSASNGGDIGWFAQGQLPPQFSAFSEAAFKLKPGTYSQSPVHTSLGWHIIYVVAKRPVEVPPFEKLDSAIRGRLGQQAVQKLVQGLREKAAIEQFDASGKPVKG